MKNRQNNNHRFWLWYFLFLFCLLGAVYIRYPLNGELIVSGDGTSCISIGKWVERQLLQGKLPLWSAEAAAGVPISSHMLGIFFLPQTLLSLLPDVWFIWVVECLFPALGACFFGKYLEELGVSRRMAAAAALSLLFAVAYGGARKCHVAIIESTGFYPLVFFAFQRYLNTGKRTAILLAGTATGCILLVATPSIQYAMYLMIGLLIYVLLWLIPRKEKITTICTDAALYLAVTAGVAAAQAIPGYLLMSRYSTLTGGSTKIAYEAFTSYSLHPAKLLIAFFPTAFHNCYTAFGTNVSSEMDIELFLGTGAAAIIVFGLLRYRRDKRIYITAAVALCIFLYACGGNIPLLPKIVYRLPFLSSVRCPARALFLFVFLNYTIFAVTCMLVYEKNDFHALRVYLGVYILALAAVLSLAYLTQVRLRLEALGEINMDGRNVASHALFGPVVSEIIVCAGCAVKKRRTYIRSAAITAVVLLAVIEAFPYSTSCPHHAPLHTETSVQDYLKKNIGSGKTITTHIYIDGANASETAGDNIQFKTGIPSLNSYLTYNAPGLCTLLGNDIPGITFFNFSGLLTGYPSMEELLAQNSELSALGVRYIEDTLGLLNADYRTADGAESVYVPVAETENGTILYENMRAKELFFSVARVVSCEDDVLAQSPRGRSYSEEAYVSGLPSNDYSNGSVQIENIEWLSNSKVQAKITAENETFVVFSQSYDKNWCVFIDGREVYNYKADLALQGTVVPAGEHTLTYRYLPTDVFLSLVVSVLTLTAVIVCMARFGIGYNPYQNGTPFPEETAYSGESVNPDRVWGDAVLRIKWKKYSFLFSELVKRDFTKKYKRTILGMAWSILSPLLNLVIMWLVFSRIFGNNVNHYAVYLFAGQLVFSYFTDATNLGMNSLVGNSAIFTKINVPKYLFLLSQNVSSLINFGLTLLIFFVFVAIDGLAFTWKFFLLLYPIGCLVVFNIGLGLVLSSLFVFFRDMQYLWGILTQLIMWMSAIFYTIDAYSYKVQCLFLLNPLYLFIRYFRKIVIDAAVPTLWFHLLMAAFSLFSITLGAYMYRKNNHEFLYYV